MYRNGRKGRVFPFPMHCIKKGEIIWKHQKHIIVAFADTVRKIDVWDLLDSDYVYGLCDIFRCNGMLAFRFSKGGFVYSALYDLKEEKQIYCAPIAEGVKGSRVPLINAIVGAYKSQFISVLSSEYLNFQKHNNPDLLEEYLPGYDADDGNPVIAFYDVVR